jgi:diketogulonate reductase-like aldo/keto reductase
MGALGAAIKLGASPGTAQSGPVIKKSIPSSGQQLAVIGMGSSRTFDVGDDPKARDVCCQVLQTFFDMGGEAIDSSPMYGTSPQVIGYCLKRTQNKQALFSATKVWTETRVNGIAQMENSERLWGVKRFDLMQIHNLMDWRTHLETLIEWKKQGRIRYLGISTSHGRRHAEFLEIMGREPLDFVQFTYNVLDREAERHLLPLAAERKQAVMVNRAFRRGELFKQFGNKPLPEWAGEFDCANWAQFFLKFVVSHPAVTCVIPATRRVDHMKQNMGANYGRLPDAAMRKRMIEYVESL